jgi:diguanylate cyclase (GGDEF)-like protein
MKKDMQELKKLQSKIKSLKQELDTNLSTNVSDNITDTLNKRGLIYELEKADEDYKKSFINFSLVMVDIDNFKQVNENYGREAGDVILKNFASIIKKNLKDGDLCARYEMDRFIVVLRATNSEDAFNFANKIHNIMKNIRFSIKGEKIHLTFTGTIVSRVEFHGIENTLKGVVDKLRKAKQGERDRVVLEL